MMERPELEAWDDDLPIAMAGSRSSARRADKASDPDEVNPVLLSAMIAAIKERPEAQAVAEADMIRICVTAIKEGMIGDAAWLNRQLVAASSSDEAYATHVEPVVSSTAESHSPLAPPVMVENLDDELKAAPLPAEPSSAEEAAKRAISQIAVPPHRVVTSREDLDDVLQQHRHWVDATLDPRLVAAPPGRANLTGSELAEFDLHDVDLRGATLKKVDLRGANLAGANLATANLTGANLAGANLTAANLKRCTLVDADLRGATLNGTQLRMEDLKGALYDEANLVLARVIP